MKFQPIEKSNRTIVADGKRGKIALWWWEESNFSPLSRKVALGRKLKKN